MPRNKRCEICDTLVICHRKHGEQSLYLEESTYYKYSDGKVVPIVIHVYFCSREHLSKWLETSKKPQPPADLNSWVNGRKIPEEITIDNY